MKMKMEKIERKALTFAVVLSFFSGFGGIFAFFVTKSNAVLLDGVFSSVNFFAAAFAMVISKKSGRIATKRSPFGSASLENIFLLFRSLLLVSYLGFSLIGSAASLGGENAISSTINLFGKDIDTSVFLGIYSGAMVLISGLIIWNNKKLNNLVDNQSQILKIESRSAFIDSAVSVGSVLALIGSMMIVQKDGFAGFIKNNADPIIVIILASFLLIGPIRQFMIEIKRLTGVRVDHAIEHKVWTQARHVLKEDLMDEGIVGDFKLRDVYAVQRGKHIDVFISVSYEGAKTIRELDVIRDEIRKELEEDIPNADVDVLWTANKIHRLD